MLEFQWKSTISTIPPLAKKEHRGCPMFSRPQKHLGKRRDLTRDYANPMKTPRIPNVFHATETPWKAQEVVDHCRFPSFSNKQGFAGKLGESQNAVFLEEYGVPCFPHCWVFAAFPCVSSASKSRRAIPRSWYAAPSLFLQNPLPGFCAKSPTGLK